MVQMGDITFLYCGNFTPGARREGAAGSAFLTHGPAVEAAHEG